MLLRWPDEEMSQHKSQVQWGQLMDCPFGFTGQEVLGEMLWSQHNAFGVNFLHSILTEYSCQSIS